MRLHLFNLILSGICIHLRLSAEGYGIMQPKIASVTNAFGSFFKELQMVYFKGCSTVIFHEPSSLHHDEKFQPDEKEDRLNMDIILRDIVSSSRIIFTLEDSLSSTLEDMNLNTITHCPVYVTVAPMISSVSDFYALPNKDWDKYFLSRKHIIYTESSIEDIKEFMKAGEISTMTQLLIIRPYAGSSPALHVYTNNPYAPSTESWLNFLMVWRGGSLSISTNLFPDKLRNFHGHKMKVVAFHFPPRIFLVKKHGITQVYGVDIEVLKALSKALNFSLSYSRPSDNEMWGWDQGNGSWTGLMGDLQYRKADIGVADLYIMENYFTIIDMSIEYDIEYLCFVNLVPGPLPQWMALGLPFLLESWIAVCITIVAGMIFIVLLRYCGYFSGRDEVQWFNSPSNTSLLLFSIVLNNAWTRGPSTSHMRIFLTLWSVAFFILASAYRGNLISYLTVPLEQPPIDTHKQLYEKGTDVGSMGNTFKNLMEKNADPYVRLLANRYQMIPSPDVGFQRTLQGKFSFFESRGFLEYMIALEYTDRRGRASLHVMREYIAPFGIGVAYPKYVPYIAKFNELIRRLKEAGFAKKWMSDIILRSKSTKPVNKEQASNKRTDTQIGAAEKRDEATVQPLTLDNLQGGFILLGIGLGLGLLTIAVEITNFSFRNFGK